MNAAILAAAVPLKEPKDWILYLPAGEHQISCMVDGKPKTITAKNTKAAAAALQRDLEAASDTRRPFIDFDHEGKRAAGWIKAFRWTEAGVEAKVEWTEEGRAAVTGGSLRYFSPEWRIDLATGECMGLLPVRPAGGLVNLPAFESMAAVAAKLAYMPETFPAAAGQNKKPKKTMNEQITEACIKAGLLSQDESAADNAAELVSTRLSALKGAESSATASAAAAVAAKAEVDEAKAQAAAALAEVQAMRVQAAKDAVTAAQAAGKIPPQDAASADFWTGALSQPGDAGAKAKAALNALPSVLPKPSDSVQNTKPGIDIDAVEAAAAAAFKANPAVPLQEHWAAAIAAAKPQA